MIGKAHTELLLKEEQPIDLKDIPLDVPIEDIPISNEPISKSPGTGRPCGRRASRMRRLGGNRAQSWPSTCSAAAASRWGSA